MESTQTVEAGKFINDFRQISNESLTDEGLLCLNLNVPAVPF